MKHVRQPKKRRGLSVILVVTVLLLSMMQALPVFAAQPEAKPSSSFLVYDPAVHPVQQDAPMASLDLLWAKILVAGLAAAVGAVCLLRKDKAPLE